MNDILVRQARIGDAVDIVELHSHSIRALCSGDYSSEQIEAWIGNRTPAFIAQRIAAVPYFAAVWNGKLVGYAAYNPESRELLSLFVDPDYARQGVALALMSELLVDARSLGMTDMWLESSLTAVTFYEKVGFVRDHETVHFFNGIPLECLRMEMSFTG